MLTLIVAAVFGLVFAAFAEAGKSQMTFICNSVSSHCYMDASQISQTDTNKCVRLLHSLDLLFCYSRAFRPTAAAGLMSDRNTLGAYYSDSVLAHFDLFPRCWVRLKEILISALQKMLSPV
jgi:hypothetical protein